MNIDFDDHSDSTVSSTSVKQFNQQPVIFPLKPPSERNLDGIKRIIVIGDLHGDLDIFKNILVSAGCIDIETQSKWISPPGWVVIQLGDQLDDLRPGIDIPAKQERALLEFWDDIAMQAHTAGSAVWGLYGNHEIMNIQGNDENIRYYVSATGKDAFDKNRLVAFAPGSPWALKLAQTRQAMIRLGPYLFVHGGVSWDYAINWSIEETNKVIDFWVRGNSQQLSDPERHLLLALLDINPSLSLSPEDNPLWSRVYSKDIVPIKDCQYLEVTLAAYNAHLMIVAHTPQFMGINCVCECLAVRADVGNSRAFGDAYEGVRGQYLSIDVRDPRNHLHNIIKSLTIYSDTEAHSLETSTASQSSKNSKNHIKRSASSNSISSLASMAS